VIFNALYYFANGTNITIFEQLATKYSFLNWMKEALLFSAGEWFLWTLFLALALMLALNWVGGKFNQIAFWVASLFFVAILLFLPYSAKDYLRLFELEWYFMFALLGYIVAKCAGLARSPTRPLFLVSILYFVLLYWNNWNGGWAQSSLRNLAYYFSFDLPFFYVERLAQAVLGIVLVLFVSTVISKNKFVLSVFAWLGRFSLGIYLFHMFFSGLGFGSGWVLVSTSFVFSLLLGVILTYLCSKIPSIKRIWLKGAFAREIEPRASNNPLKAI
jgi:hypothetical protein